LKDIEQMCGGDKVLFVEQISEEKLKAVGNSVARTEESLSATRVMSSERVRAHAK
jgi:hypothetical protein